MLNDIQFLFWPYDVTACLAPPLTGDMTRNAPAAWWMPRTIDIYITSLAGKAPLTEAGVSKRGLLRSYTNHHIQEVYGVPSVFESLKLCTQRSAS